MIPMRDGVRLHTEIYSPKNASEPLPMLFERTPYGISSANRGYSQMLSRYDAMIYRRVHLRLPGHSRALRFRGKIRHAAAHP